MKRKKISFFGKEDANAKYVFLPLPYEKSVSYGRGTKYGPEAILRASLQIEDIDDETLLPYDINAYTMPSLSFEGMRKPEALEKIYHTALPLIKENRFLVSLGGEHTITFPLAIAVSLNFSEFSVLQIDAHLDLHDKFRNNSFSHACVMRRIWQINNRINVVPVGIRSVASDENNFLKEKAIAFFHANQCRLPDTKWIDDVIKNLKENVYITLDVDAFDPSIIPATGTPEPNGLGWKEVMLLLQEVCRNRKVIAMDVVELAPIKGLVSSEYIIARFILKFLMWHKSYEK